MFSNALSLCSSLNVKEVSYPHRNTGLQIWRVKVKVKFSLYRPWRPVGLREFEAPTFSDIRLIDGGKVVSPMRRPLFTPR
jgi:hypothetical protein